MLGYASYEDIHGEVPNTLTERLEVMEEEEVDAISEAMDTVILLGEKIQLMKKTYMKHFKVLWILKFRLIKNFSILMKRAETYVRHSWGIQTKETIYLKIIYWFCRKMKCGNLSQNFKQWLWRMSSSWR